jgi:hypothetical protein
MSKEDRNKMIGLVVAIVLVFGFAGWRIMGATGGAPTPTAPVTASEAAPVASLSATDVDEPDMIDLPPVTLAINTDPFRKILTSNVPMDDEPDPRKPKPTAQPSGRPGRLSGIPPLPFPGDNSQGSGVRPMEIPPEATLAADKANLTLSGVIPGKNGSATIAVGSETHVVQVGEKFAGGLVLTSIGNGQVTLQRGTEKITLQLGDSSGTN